MPVFEVTIPPEKQSAADEKHIKVEAGSWVLAFKIAMERSGEAKDTVKNIMVEKDAKGCMKVLHPKSGRVFLVKNIESGTDESGPATKPPPPASPPAHIETNAARQEQVSGKAASARNEDVAVRPSQDTPAQPPATRKKTREEALKHFQVYIPAGEHSGADFTLTLTAPSWIAAVKSGLARIGEPPDSVKNIMVERNPDGSMLVSHPKSNRVFRVRELTAKEAASQAAMSVVSPDVRERPEATPPADIPPPPIPSDAAQPSLSNVVVEGEATAAREADLEFLEPESIPPAEDLLESFFEDAALLGAMSVQDAVDFCLDLALDKIDAEGGAIILADINRGDLFYSTSRGPWADSMPGRRVASDQGLLGFVVDEGVGVVLSESDDPEMVSEIGHRLSAEVLNVMYAPIEADRRILGAIELVNRIGRQSFAQEELNALTFLGTKLGERMVLDEGGWSV